MSRIHYWFNKEKSWCAKGTSGTIGKPEAEIHVGMTSVDQFVPKQPCLIARVDGCQTWDCTTGAAVYVHNYSGPT